MESGRRDVLRLFAATSGAAALTPLLGRSGHAAAAADTIPAVAWPYRRLNPEIAAEHGYTGYYKGACCHGAFEAIISQLREEVGFPYTRNE